MANQKPINVGIVGYGNSARVFHLPYITRNPDLNVVAFVQRTPAPKAGDKSIRHCTVDYPTAKHYTTVADFLKDADVDLVLVLTGHGAHAEVAEKALLAGKHVVVEKPFVISSAEAETVLAARDKSGKILSVFQNRRYDSDFQTLLDLTERNAFGTITEAEIHYDLDLPGWMSGMTSPGWKPGEGMNFGIGCHSLDQVLKLFGRPKSVTAFYRTLRGVESEAEDSFTMTLQYANSPLLVHVKTHVASTMRYPLKYFVRGYDGTFIKHGTDQQEDQTNAGLTPASPGFGVEPEDMYGELTTKTQVLDSQVQVGNLWIGKVKSHVGDYGRYYADVVKALRGTGPLVVDPAMSADGIRIIELARESAYKGVTLPF